MSDIAARKLTRLIIGTLLVQLVVVGYVFWTGYQGRVDIVTTQRLGCERGKLDRKDNAKFQTAQKEYIDKVVLAGSVKEDVKKAARKAVETFNVTSASLTERAAIHCSDKFPKARLIP